MKLFNVIWSLLVSFFYHCLSYLLPSLLLLPHTDYIPGSTIIRRVSISTWVGTSQSQVQDPHVKHTQHTAYTEQTHHQTHLNFNLGWNRSAISTRSSCEAYTTQSIHRVNMSSDAFQFQPGLEWVDHNLADINE